MGCDIHIVLEQRNVDTGRWVGLRQLGYLPTASLHFWENRPAQHHIGWNIKQRDYNFFWALAGVRHGDGPPGIVRGLPWDVSDLARMILGDDGDLHSHSWLAVTELVPIIMHCKMGGQIPNAVANKLLGGPEIDIAHDWLGIEHIESPTEYVHFRIVFAFDN